MSDERDKRPERPKRKYEPPFKGVVKRDQRGPRRTWQERHAEQAQLDAEREDGRSRWRAELSRHTRRRGRDAAAVLAVLVVGIAITLGIISQQNASLPAWIPLFGEEFFELEAELETAQAINPGQGQAVMVSGVQVGLIDSVELEDGIAVVGMDIEPRFAPIIRADAGILVRPRTNLNDITLQIDPGEAAEPIEEGTRITLDSTKPTVQPDEFFSTLDRDTRSYLTLLLDAGAKGLDGRSRQLSAGFRRLEPFTRFIAQFTSEVAKRREALARVIHNFRRLTEELGRRDTEIQRFVSESAGALEGFANRNQEIEAALRELPPTLRTTRDALESSTEFSASSREVLADLTPQADALEPALQATRRFFERTTEPIADQLRPFAREVRPVLRHTAQGSDALEQTVDNFGEAIGSLNTGFNELAFNPGPQRPGYLFYLPWLNHGLNASYLTGDAGGPIRRGLLLFSCAGANVADGFLGGDRRPFLNTVSQLTGRPTGEELCPF